MKRTLMAVLAMGIIAAGTSRLEAVSTPVIQGGVSGIELCPQDWCGVAIFAGIFQGRVGANPNAFGFMIVAVNHTPLQPNPGGVSTITNGVFELNFGLRRVRGGVGGFLVNNGDNTYSVHTTLPIVSGATGSLAFDGILDHNVFPPTIQGPITQ
ncbi:MAG TPA: hypothetical protein VFO19_06485 [Vicinamibacterales bacterium]|nr:hypothetical protein [Vicinamibacterales bacterium]